MGQFGRSDPATHRRTSAWPTEAGLLKAARSGSHEALGELFREYGQQMLNVAYRVTGSTHDAEDVVQDLFAGLPEALRGYDGTGSFAAWLRRLATRVALLWLRRERRRNRRDQRVAEEATAEVRPVPVEARLTLERVLNRMPEDLRAVYVLKEVEGYAHADIAELLGITTGASETRLHRARRFLRDRLKGKL